MSDDEQCDDDDGVNYDEVEWLEISTSPQKRPISAIEQLQPTAGPSKSTSQPPSPKVPNKKSKGNEFNIDQMILQQLSGQNEPEENAHFLKELGQLLKKLPEVVQMETKIEIQQLVLQKFKDNLKK